MRRNSTEKRRRMVVKSTRDWFQVGFLPMLNPSFFSLHPFLSTVGKQSRRWIKSLCVPRFA